MNRADAHFLNCDDRDCEKTGCVARRDYERRIANLEDKCLLLRTRNRAMVRLKPGENKMAKLELAVLVGAESKQWLADLTTLVERMETIAPASLLNGASTSKKKAATTAFDDEETEAEEDAAPRKSKKAKPVSDDDEEFDLAPPTTTASKKRAAARDEETEDEEPAALTLEEMAVKCRAKRTTAIAALQKLGVERLNDLKPSLYPKLLKMIGG